MPVSGRGRGSTRPKAHGEIGVVPQRVRKTCTPSGIRGRRRAIPRGRSPLRLRHVQARNPVHLMEWRTKQVWSLSEKRCTAREVDDQGGEKGGGAIVGTGSETLPSLVSRCCWSLSGVGPGTPTT